MVGSVGVGVVAVGVRLVIISHISDHFVVRVLVGVMVWVVKQFEERVKPGNVMSVVFGKIRFFLNSNNLRKKGWTFCTENARTMKANILLRADVIVRLKALIVFVNFISRDLRD